MTEGQPGPEKKFREPTVLFGQRSASNRTPQQNQHTGDDNIASRWCDLGCNIIEKTEPLEDLEEWVDREILEEDILTWDV